MSAHMCLQMSVLITMHMFVNMCMRVSLHRLARTRTSNHIYTHVCTPADVDRTSWYCSHVPPCFVFWWTAFSIYHPNIEPMRSTAVGVRCSESCGSLLLSVRQFWRTCHVGAPSPSSLIVRHGWAGCLGRRSTRSLRRPRLWSDTNERICAHR